MRLMHDVLFSFLSIEEFCDFLVARSDINEKYFLYLAKRDSGAHLQ